MRREIWSANYRKALPVSVQDFDLRAVLPAVFYMFRFGYRRGKGRFVDAFAEGDDEDRRKVNIERVAQVLSGRTNWFEGFDDEVRQAILGDLILCFCLENRGHAPGRTEPIQRVAPAHYMAGWVDLPENVGHLRFVPEMVVALLANQEGEFIRDSGENEKTWFPVARRFDENVLLKAFNHGIVHQGPIGDRAGADRFREDTPVGIDQLLMIRLAQEIGQAPEKLRGEGGSQIPNQLPICEQAVRWFSEDIRNFVRGYSNIIPRQAFLELLESCMALGLTTVIAATIDILFEWADTGKIRVKHEQRPVPFLVDCSKGTNTALRGLAEQSMDDFMRRIERFPVVFMALRLLDYQARYDRSFKNRIPTSHPYATAWLDTLGDILHDRDEGARLLFYDLDRKAQELAEAVGDDYPHIADILRDEESQHNPVWRLAEALTVLQGRQNAQQNLIDLLDSALLINHPNGLASKRKVLRREGEGGKKKWGEARSIVLTDSALDYLVHRHLLRKGTRYRWVSLREFIRCLKERYGFHIDEAPPGMPVSAELLGANRSILERRLRDLGLLVSVSDAEAMKHLRPRFKVPEEDHANFDSPAR